MPSTSEGEHSSPNPLGDAAATEDQVGLAVRSAGTTIAFEVAWLSVVGWGTSALSRAADITRPEQLSNNSPQVNLIIWGTLSAVFLGAAITWSLLGPVRSNFRRGGLAIVAAAAGLLAGGALSFLAGALLGSNAPLVLAGLMAIVTILLARSARAAARALPSSDLR